MRTKDGGGGIKLFTERLSNLPRMTEWIASGAEIQIQAV